MDGRMLLISLLKGEVQDFEITQLTQAHRNLDESEIMANPEKYEVIKVGQ